MLLIKPPACSSTLSNVYYSASLLRHGLVWRIGNGEDVHFWSDSWSGCGPIYDQSLDPFLVDNDLLVQDFLLDNDWDATLLYACLPSDVVVKILSIPIFCCHRKDKLVWKHTPNGTFSVKSSYWCAIEASSAPSCRWKLIWNLQIPPS